jgi:hypothetical protein
MPRNQESYNRMLAESMREAGDAPDSMFHSLELGPVPSAQRPEPPDASDLVDSYHEADYQSLMAEAQSELVDQDTATTVGVLEGDEGLIAQRRGFRNRLRQIRETSAGRAAATMSRRIGNLVEGTAGRLFMAPMYVDNAWMAYLASPSKPVTFNGKPVKLFGLPLTHTDWEATKDRMKRAVLPEVTYNNYVKEQESTPVVDQLLEIQDTGLAVQARAQGDGIWGLMDREPLVMEGVAEMANYQDAVVQRMFQGDEAAYGAWLQDQSNVKRNAHLAGLAVFQSVVQPSWLIGATKWGAEAFGWPLKLAGKAVAKVTPAPVKAAAVRLGSKEVFRKQHDIADLDALVTTTRATEERLQQEFDLTGREDIAEKLVQAQKRAADARLKLANHTANINADPILLRAPRSNPEMIADLERMDPDQALSIRPSQYRALRARRISLAEKIAPQAEVEEELKKVGFASWDDYLERMGKVHREVKKGQFSSDPSYVASLNPMIEDMRRAERLPEHIKQHLSIRGLSRDRLTSAAALMREPHSTAHIAEWADFSNPAMLEQRLIGPDNAEDIAHALTDLAQGASPDHVFVYDSLIPEHDIIGRGELPVWANNYWIGGDKAVWENGRKVLEGDAYWSAFMDRGQPGLSKGSKVLNAYKVVKGGLNRAFHDVRQPMSAYGELPTHRLLKRASGNHHTFTVAANEAARESTSKLAPEAVEMVNRALQAEDEFALEGFLSKMSEETKQAYRVERARWDYHADRLGLKPGESIKQYVAAVIPHEDLEAGNKIIELIAPGTKSTVGFRHLLPRLGEQGYVEGYHEIADVYHRLLFRKLIMEPAYKQALDIADIYASRGMQGQAAYTRRMVDSVRGTPQGLSRLIDHNLGLAFNRAANYTERAAATVGSLLYAGMLGFKGSYLLQQIATGVNNLGAEYGAFSTVKGLMRLGSKEGLELAKKSGVAGVARHITENEDGFVQKLTKAYAKWGGVSSSEDAIRYLSHQAALGDLLQRSGKTWSQVVAEGRGHAYQAEAYDAVLRTQHMYGGMGRSPYFDHWLGKPLAGLLLQFSQYPGFAYKQTEMLAKMAAQDPGALMRYFAVGGILLRTLDQYHVDASRTVGMGYLKGGSGPGGLINSPTANMLHEMQGFNEALNSDDPAKVKLAGDRAGSWLTQALPGVSAIAKAHKQGKQSAEMEVRGQKGDFVRSLEPGEKLPVALGLPTVEGRIHRQIQEQQLQAARDWLAARKDGTERFIKRVDSGDLEGAVQLAEELANMGIPLSSSMLEAQTQARYVGRVLRTQLKYVDILPPELLDQINAMSQFPQELQPEPEQE